MDDLIFMFKSKALLMSYICSILQQLCPLITSFLAGSFLAPFTSLKAYEVFYNRVLDSPAIQKYCFHGGRIMQWLPYMGWDDITGEVNVTYYRSNNQLSMHEAWRKNNPKSNDRPYCVIARMGR